MLWCSVQLAVVGMYPLDHYVCAIIIIQHVSLPLPLEDAPPIHQTPQSDTSRISCLAHLTPIQHVYHRRYVDSNWDGDSSSDQAVGRLLRANIEPLLLETKVDLCMWGHHHTYQRTKPVFNATINPAGLVNHCGLVFWCSGVCCPTLYPSSRCAEGRRN